MLVAACMEVGCLCGVGLVNVLIASRVVGVLPPPCLLFM